MLGTKWHYVDYFDGTNIITNATDVITNVYRWHSNYSLIFDDKNLSRKYDNVRYITNIFSNYLDSISNVHKYDYNVINESILNYSNRQTTFKIEGDILFLWSREYTNVD